jgi:hypothetical protein
LTTENRRAEMAKTHVAASAAAAAIEAAAARPEVRGAMAMERAGLERGEGKLSLSPCLMVRGVVFFFFDRSKLSFAVVYG